MNEVEQQPRPLKILEYKARCPLCGKEGVVEEFLYKIPFFGEVLLSTFKCPHCGYKHSDVTSLEESEPVQILYRIEKPGDERALFIKSSAATIKIPEVDIEVSPGLFSQGEITTVEGVITRVIDVLRYACENPSPACSSKIDYLEGVLRGLKPVTIVVSDPTGVSRILSEKAIVKKLSE